MSIQLGRRDTARMTQAAHRRAVHAKSGGDCGKRCASWSIPQPFGRLVVADEVYFRTHRAPRER
jgi:hypothetical protein